MNSKYLWEELNLKENFKDEEVDIAFKELENKNKDNIFAWKVLRDKYYKEVYKKYLDVSLLIKAGFIENNLKLEEVDYYNLDLLTTPVGKILNKLDDKKINNPVVLISTGGFFPLHEGHIHMMEIAKKTLEDSGFTVIGGYFSPSHDTYVSTKPFCNKNKFERIEECREYVKDSNWLMIDPWESMYVNTYVNFTEVVNRLELYLKMHVNENIKVAYVCGGDNADFMYCFEHLGIGVCINRTGYDNNFIDIQNSIKSKSVFWGDENTANYNFSSRNIRKVLNNPSDSITKEIHDGTYIIRDEDILPLLHYKKIVSEEKLRNAQKEFLNEFILLLKRTLDYQIEVKTVNVKEQIEMADNVLSGKKTISLDSYYNGTYNLSVSRMFDISDIQYKYISLVERIGSNTIDKQTNIINPGEYTIVDDDSVTGNTLNNIRRFFPENIKTEQVYLLSSIIKDKVFDVVDLRDFIIGAENSGLVVRLPNNKVARAPYILPYVSLRNRANIPPSLELDFSLRIWELNKKFYENIGKHITLSNISEESKILLEYIGFKEDISVIDICNWHIRKIKKII